MADNYDMRRFGAGTIARPAEQALFDAGLRRHMLSVYNYMASGLALSGIVALLVYSVPAFNTLFYAVQPNGRIGFTGLGYVAMFAPLGMLFLAMFAAQNMSARAAQVFYWAFTALQGVGLAILLYRYTGGSVARAFFVTAGAFAALSLYGYTTKRNLGPLGAFLIIGLVGALIAMLVNIFVASQTLQLVLSLALVFIFAGLTAYDTQRIKEQYSDAWDHGTADKVAIFAALGLYLNFINLFQLILSFMGTQRE